MRNFVIWCGKYLNVPALLIIGFIVYILFFQENSVGRIYDINYTIDSLNRVIAAENDSLEIYLEKNRKLDNNDPEMIERIVREQHNMSMPTEETFIVEQRR